MSYEDDFNHLKIQLEDIMKATHNFCDKWIGKGGFGQVYKGELNLRDREGRSTVAFKRLDREFGQGDIEFWKEIVMLSKLRHENLVSLLHFCNEGDERILVYEYATRGSLDSHLGDPNLTWTRRLQICIGVARGLKYLHTPRETHDRVLHRDIKSANILLDEKWNAKLSDFGLSKIGPANQSRSYLISTPIGTHGYCDPWYYKTNELTKESDVYSFGVVLFEVMCGRICHEFHNGKVRILVDTWQKCYDEERLSDVIYDDSKEKIDKESLKTFSTIANRCLNYKRVERPLMVEIIQELDIALQQQQQLVLAMINRNEFCIPDYILVPGGKVEAFIPVCPTIVFVNSKSGGQLGGELLVTYRSVLNKNQVFDLGEEAPDKVLRRLYLTLENLKLNGDALAVDIEKKLRIIVAGGDGTAGWLLGVVSDLKLSHPPPIATVPLGTDNNLPFAFGWGKKNPGTNRESVLHFLDQVKKGNEMEIDSWHFLMRMKSAPKGGSCDPIAPLELPHSLHAFSRVSATDELNVSGYDTFHGGFWNYFSMGMDAQVSYAFHCERKLHPEKFKNQLANQSTYAKIGRTQEGWFASSRFRPTSKDIAQLVKVKIMHRDGGWKDLKIHHSIRSILCLNLPSFSGGLNPWGTPDKDKTRDRNLTPPYVDDGFLEIVGFRDAWHGIVLLAPKGHRTRLAQTHRVRFEFHKGEAECTYMSMDGEPWKQPLPEDDDTTIIEISHLGRVKILATVQNCKSRSVNDPSTPHHYQEEDGDDSENEEDTPTGEEWRKFGAAETFKIPEDVDLSRLS